jgi:hypothetical protein
MTQSFFVKTGDEIGVTKLFKYEDFEEALPYLEEKGIKDATKFRVRYGRSNDWENELSEESKSIIEREYEMDFDLWESL